MPMIRMAVQCAVMITSVFRFRMQLTVMLWVAVVSASVLAAGQGTDAEAEAVAPSAERRPPRSLFTLFVDGVKSIHDKLHDNQDNEKVKDEEKDKTVKDENEDQKRNVDLPVLIKSGCETQFVLVESVHYTEVIKRDALNCKR